MGEPHQIRLIENPESRLFATANVQTLTLTPKNDTCRYEDTFKQIGSFTTVEGFWSYYSHMVPAGELNSTSDYHIFRDNIRPMWEDAQNKHGGKWVLRMRKGLASQIWENLVLAIIGNQFDVGDEVCGAVVSVRYEEDIISIWTKTASREDITMKIKETMKRLLQLPNSTVIVYKTHDSSLRGSSGNFRGGGRSGGGGGYR